MKLQFTILCILVKIINSQKPSPCPSIFTYEPKGSEHDRWYGVISLSTTEDLSGVWLRIKLDQPAELLGNWFGETLSEDNKDFTIRNQKYELEAGPPVLVRFFVKYNTDLTVPSLETIKLNGRTICAASKKNVEATTPTLHISQLRPNKNQNRNSSGSSSENSRPLNSEEERPTSHRPNTQTNVRPSNNTPRPSGTTFSGTTLSTNGRPAGHRPTTSNSGSSSNSNGNSESDNDSDFFQGDFMHIFSPSVNKSGSTSDEIGTKSTSCGVVAARAAPLIAQGQETWKGQWPWHAALYHSKGIQLVYTCGGTLISEQHIVTAAHCVTKPRTTTTVNPKNLIVYLGKYSLVNFGAEVQDRGVSEIIIHPDYDNKVYFNDIAVLKLTRPVTITNFVRPCCLWEGDTNLDRIILQEGIVVGWGFDETNKLSSSLMQATMPIVSTVECIFSNRDFYSQFTFDKNYCAGYRNGTSVCNGDSGGGMVFRRRGSNGQNSVWQLRGLVSIGVALQGQGTCDTSQYVVFTDVAKYTHWIRQVIAQ